MAFVACGSEEMPAYMDVTVAFDESIVVDQLGFEVLRDGNPISPTAMRPENPAAQLTTDLTVTILVPSSTEGRELSVRAAGYFAGNFVTSGRVDDIVPLPGRGVPVYMTLGHVLQTFAVEPASVSVPLGTAVQLVANATFSDENDGDVSELTTWVSSNAEVLAISADEGSRGLALAVGEGTATVTATLNDRTVVVPVTVGASKLIALGISPSFLTLPMGSSSTLQATAAYSDGASRDVSAEARWQTTNANVLTVDAEGRLRSVNPGQAQVDVSFGGQQAQAIVNVIIPQLESVVIEPADARIAAGFTRQFLAFGINSDGSRTNITSAVTFSVDRPELATLNAMGLLTGNAAGDIVVTAVAPQGPFASVRATITNAALVAFSITPTTPTVPLGPTVSFQATGVYSDGTDSDITAQVTWDSSNTDVATVPVGSSTFTTVGVGTTTVRATPPDGSIPLPVTTTLNVTTAALDHITVAPSSSSIAKGQSATFTATGILTDGTTTDLTAQAVWTSSNTTVATMAANVATAQAPGSTSIGASFAGKSGQAALTVTDVSLLSIAITPSPASVVVGTSQQMVATGTYSDGTRTITDQVTWSLTNAVPNAAGATVATIGTASGIVSGVSAGTATVRAQLSGVTGTLPLTVVGATLTSIAISPASPTVVVGGTLQLTALGTFDNGTQRDVTSTVQWSSLDPPKATVNNGGSKGLVTGVSAGAARIKAAQGAVSVTQSVTVSAASLTSVTIDQAQLTLASGATGQLTAKAHYSTGPDVDITKTGVWLSSDTSVATIDNGMSFGGRVNAAGGAATGTSTATIAFGGQTSAGVTITVNPAVLTSITVQPAALNIDEGKSANLQATGNYSDGSTRIITNDVVWSLPPNATRIATISNAPGEKGKLTALAKGSTTATAALGTVSGKANITVKKPPK